MEWLNQLLKILKIHQTKHKPDKNYHLKYSDASTNSNFNTNSSTITSFLLNHKPVVGYKTTRINYDKSITNMNDLYDLIMKRKRLDKIEINNNNNNNENLENKYLTDSLDYNHVNFPSQASCFKTFINKKRQIKSAFHSNDSLIQNTRIQSAKNRVSLAYHFKIPKKIAPMSAKMPNYKSSNDFMEQNKQLSISVKKKDEFKIQKHPSFLLFNDFK